VLRTGLALLAAFVVAGCGGSSDAPKTASRTPVNDLDNVLRLRADFEADPGKTRVLLLFSPT
jgi:hypothetical protein